MTNEDWGASGRVDTFSFFRVDPFSLAEVDQVEVDAESSTMTWGYYTDNLLTASLELSDSDYRTNERDYMIRAKQTTSIGGAVYTRTLGTVFVDGIGSDMLFGRTRRSVDCYSALWRCTQDVIVQDFWRGAGSSVVGAIRDVVEVDGGTLSVGSDVDTSRTFSRDIFFELGTSRSKVINTIAGWIDCQLGIDPDGRITINKYISPLDRAVAYTFADGKNCTYLPGISNSTNRGDAVNRVVAYYSRDNIPDGDMFPFTDRAMVDLDDGADFSYARCGRRRTHIIKLNDACSHQELEAKARTYLRENCGAILYIEIEHVSVPSVTPGAVVTYINDVDYGYRVEYTCLVVDVEMALNPGGLCKTKMKVLR